jgi:putative endonuclease
MVDRSGLGLQANNTSSTTAVARGRAAEDVAVDALVARGYVVVARNVCVGGAEIDVIAHDGPVLCFIEVRRRRTAKDAAWSITPKKQARIARAAAAWLARHPSTSPCRFDVVLLAGAVGKDGGEAIRVLRGAFEATS